MKRRITLVFIETIIVALPLCAAAEGVQNPLNSSVSTIPTFISGVLAVMVQIGLPIVALFLLIAGFKFASAGGNAGKLSEAKENFVYVILGALLILGAAVLATLIAGTVTKVVGNGPIG